MATARRTPTPRGRASTPSEPADLRRRVLDAALEIITTSGPEAISMRDVARRAGVSHQAPYHHFVDRAGIFAAIGTEGYTIFDTEMRHTLETSPEPAIDCLRTYVNFALAHPGHFRVMGRSDLCGTATHPDAMAAAERSFQTVLELARRIDPAASTPEDTLVLALTLWSNAHGLAMLIIDGPVVRKMGGTMSVDDIVDRMGRRFLKSLQIQTR